MSVYTRVCPDARWGSHRCRSHCRGHRPTSGVFFHLSSSCFLRQSLPSSLDLKLTDWLPGPLNSTGPEAYRLAIWSTREPQGSCCHHPLSFSTLSSTFLGKDGMPWPVLYMGSVSSSSCLQAHTKQNFTPLPEPCLQPHSEQLSASFSISKPRVP